MLGRPVADDTPHPPQGDRKSAPLQYYESAYEPRSIVGSHPCGRPVIYLYSALEVGYSLSSSCTYFTSLGPTYSARGRIRRLLPNCSRTWAVQPEMRLHAKMGVSRSMGTPSM